ncbi:glycoside hydrolase family 32 protein [Rufibacter psychrotolerans]|uniref:glycoside hydrolase family 32 protein n=1 Tax=Rufibacter psychrotolerans TaxID=2812556 RepID=UPI0019672A2C|nr:glycoside hydrolase family 32 protein [Rufibacter sp. SYSU D00308]
MKVNKWVVLMVLMSLAACSSKDDPAPQEPGTKEEAKEVNIYPQPPSGWLGSPNPYNTTGWVGDLMPYYDNGKFHLFFLHDAREKPAGQGFHDIHKFESTNLADYAYAGRMIPYGTTTQPDFAIGTGSTVKVGNTYYMYYTGHNGIPAFVQNNPRESVLYATSTDLKTWTKNTTFKLTAPAGYYDFDFRDPQVFFNTEKNEYWMLVSTQTSARKAVVLLFTTQDPASNNWTSKGPLYTTTPEENFLMLECADVFKMGNYWYLFFSENWSGMTGTRYRMASSSEGPWVKPTHDLLDGQFFYAAKTASDGNKRYLFGWTARRMPENDTGNKEWAGNLVVHELTQAPDGTLGVKAPETVAALFTREAALQVKSKVGQVSGSGTTYQLNGTASPAYNTFSALAGSKKITAKIRIESGAGTAGFVFNADNPTQQSYKVLLEPGSSQLAAYQVSGASTQLITRVPVHVQAGTTYEVTVVISGSVCVVYLNGMVALSNRIYGMPGKAWGLTATGTQASFSEVKLLGPQ